MFFIFNIFQTANLEYYSTYTETHLTPCIKRIAMLVLKNKENDGRGKVRYGKYYSREARVA